MVYVEALSKVLPVILLFLLGAFLNRLHFIRSEAIEDMKKLVLYVTLPAVLFLAFSRVSLEARHPLIVGFFTTPVTLSILLGILANRAGVMPPLNAWPVSAAVLKTVEMVSGLTTPLIALIIGYEMRLEKVVNTLSLFTLVTLFAFAIISVLYTPASSGTSPIHLP